MQTRDTQFLYTCTYVRVLNIPIQDIARLSIGNNVSYLETLAWLSNKTRYKKNFAKRYNTNKVSRSESKRVRFYDSTYVVRLIYRI